MKNKLLVEEFNQADKRYSVKPEFKKKIYAK